MFDLSGIKFVQSEAVPKGKIVFMSGAPDYKNEPDPDKAFREWVEKYVFIVTNVGDERREGQR